jgi:hypothetical protein
MTTALQIAEKAIQLADQNPHFIYEAPGDDEFPDCVYAHDGKGSCLFGQAIIDLDVVPADYFFDREGRATSLRISELLFHLSNEGMIEGDFTEDFAYEVNLAQSQQDFGETWADAVASLREYVGKVKAA